MSQGPGRNIPGFIYDPLRDRYYRTPSGQTFDIRNSLVRPPSDNTRNTILNDSRPLFVTTKKFDFEKWSFEPVLEEATVKKERLEANGVYSYYCNNVDMDPIVMISNQSMHPLLPFKYGPGKGVAFTVDDEMEGPSQALLCDLRSGKMTDSLNNTRSSLKYNLKVGQTHWLFNNQLQKSIRVGRWQMESDRVPIRINTLYILNNQAFDHCSFSLDGRSLLYRTFTYCLNENCRLGCEHSLRNLDPPAKLCLWKDLDNEQPGRFEYLPVSGQLKSLQCLFLAHPNEFYLASRTLSIDQILDYRLADQFQLPVGRSAYWIRTDPTSHILLARTFHEELFWFDLRYSRQRSCLLNLKYFQHGNTDVKKLHTLLMNDGKSIWLTDPQDPKRLFGLDLRKYHLPHTILDTQSTIKDLFVGTDEFGRYRPIIQLAELP